MGKVKPNGIKRFPPFTLNKSVRFRKTLKMLVLLGSYECAEDRDTSFKIGE